MDKKTDRGSDLKLSTKFTLATGIILLVFCIVFSLLIYFHLKNKVIEDANEKTLVILTQIRAVGDYVRNVLRPRMFAVLPKGTDDEFVVEAMSSTHVTQQVMKQVSAELTDYAYRRVSTKPLNPNNRADALHRRIEEDFRKKPEMPVWNRIVTIEGQEHLIRARAVLAEKACLLCHGVREAAPRGIQARYGKDGMFGWTEGDVMGVESVMIPLANTLGQIKGIAISTFVFGSILLFSLFISLQGAFWSLVSRPLSRMTTLFHGIAGGTEPLNQDLPIGKRDEIGELTESFNSMAKHLHHAQEDLKKNADTLRSIFEGITDPLALVKPDCSIEITNAAYREWMAKGITAVFTKECSSHGCDADTLCPVCFLNKVKSEKRPLSEYWDGSDGRHYYIHLYPIFDEVGNVAKSIHYVKDVTERRHMEEQLRTTEKLAALGQLSAGMAHEINNPLGGIRLCLNNLIDTPMDDAMRREHAAVVNSGLEKIQRIIRQLLDFSKQSKLTVSPVSINAVIEGVLKLVDYLVAEKGVTVVRDFSADLPDIMIDRSKMEQVFLNILLNALQAMNGAGSLLTVSTSLDNGFCSARVSDTGGGIPDGVLPFIFDPFFSTKEVGQGTGLGLSVSKSIVEQHYGKILVDTSPRGTTFTVEIPVQ